MGPLLAGLGWIGLVGTPSPPPEDVQIKWRAPASCPDRAWVEARVERFLDRPLGDAAVEPVHASIEVVPEDGEMVARIVLRSGDREQRRELRDERCEVLAAATAFIVAVAIDPEAALAAELDPEPEPEPESEPAPPPDPAPTSEAPADEQRRALRGAVRVMGEGSGGLLPGFAPGVGIVGGLISGRARVEVSGEWSFERTVELGGTRSASVRSWNLGAAGCFVPSTGPVEFPLCAGASAGSMRGIGRGVADPGRASIPWVAARVGPGVAYVPSKYAAIRLGVDALVPIQRPRFLIENLGVVHEVWPVVVLGHLGVEVRFP